jgi:predicted secreted Zn-dependent protease
VLPPQLADDPAFLPPQPALDASIKEQFELQPYPVRGESVGEVRRAIAAGRPSNADGHRFDAITFWHLDWHLDRVGEKDGCRPGGVTVSLSLSMTFPDLAGVPEPTRAAFAGFLSGLRRHEEGHLRIDRGIALSVAEAIRAVPAEQSCEELDAAAKRAADKAMDEGRQRNADYDAQTRHGAAQGATYPTGR